MTKQLRPPAKLPPSQTLYVHNLNDKVNKEELQLSLYMLFSTYGQVISIICLKTKKMRGQAHIVFSDIGSSTLALKGLQGFVLFGKPMAIEYAKTKSNIVALNDKSFSLRNSFIGNDSNEGNLYGVKRRFEEPDDAEKTKTPRLE